MGNQDSKKKRCDNPLQTVPSTIIINPQHVCTLVVCVSVCHSLALKRQHCFEVQDRHQCGLD